MVHAWLALWSNCSPSWTIRCFAFFPEQEASSKREHFVRGGRRTGGHFIIISPDALVGGVLWNRSGECYSLMEVSPVMFACINEVTLWDVEWPLDLMSPRSRWFNWSWCCYTGITLQRPAAFDGQSYIHNLCHGIFIPSYPTPLWCAGCNTYELSVITDVLWWVFN